ncbi:MAG: hypothetical protein JNM56_11620 [Planctomycetia bacterium]|nr:hypothetical protein [Planctomycetia bacterium]
MTSDASSTPESTAASTNSVAVPAGYSGRKWLYRVAAFLLLAGAVYLGRVPLLTGLAWPLIVDQQPADGDWIVPFGGHAQYPQIARWCQDRPAARVLLLRLDLTRLEALGVEPRGEVVAQRELGRQGISADAITIVRGTGRAGCVWTNMRRLGGWLAEHPETRIVLTTSRFGSRRLRTILDQTMPPEVAARVQLWAIAHPWYDEANWWQRKEGVLDLFNGYIGLGYTWLCGDTSDHWQEFDPDAFDRTLEVAR